MPEPLLYDLSDAALQRAIKTNLLELFRAFSRSPVTRFSESDTLIWWQTPIPNPFFNGIFCLAPVVENPQKVIQDTLSLFQSAGVGELTWWLHPDVPVTAWEDALLANGFTYDNHTPGMAIKLEALNLPPSRLTGFQVVQINNAAHFHTWVHTFVAGYGFPDDLESTFYRFFEDMGVNPPFQHYLGLLDGVPVATATVFTGSGVAGVYNVCTLPEARRQGFGAALTWSLLNDARLTGYLAGILHSSKMGYSIYRRLGFRELCKMDHFSWSRQKE